MNCPRCTSPNIVSNKLTTPNGHVASHFVRSAREAGHPLVAGIGLALFLGGKTVNHFRKEYKCSDCRYEFDA